MIAVETDRGILLTPYDPETERALAIAAKVTKKYRNALRELAKYMAARRWPEPSWLSRVVVDAVHHDQPREHGGLPGVRGENVAEYALARPRQKWHYDNKKADIPSLAAGYAFGIVNNHPYRNVLGINGYDLDVADAGVVDEIRALASGDVQEAELADWIRKHSRPANEPPLMGRPIGTVYAVSGFGTSASVTTGPPARSVRLSVRYAMKAIDWLSGDQSRGQRLGDVPDGARPGSSRRPERSSRWSSTGRARRSFTSGSPGRLPAGSPACRAASRTTAGGRPSETSCGPAWPRRPR